MLPRRQSSGKRAFAPHTAAKRVSVRTALVGALALVFLVLCYFNMRFFSTTNARIAGAAASAEDSGVGKTVAQLLQEHKAALESKLLHEHRQVKHVVFTSGCSGLDLIHAEVLAHSVRASGYEHNVTHLMYGCTSDAFAAVVKKKNPAHRVRSHAFPNIQEPAYTFGEGHVTTTLHPGVVLAWLEAQRSQDLAPLHPSDFVMLVDSDAVFTKKLDVRNLFREAEDVTDPQGFGQDAAWYWPGKSPLPEDKLADVAPARSSRLFDVTDWRPFAATAPFVLELRVLERLLPTATAAWAKLALDKRHLAIPLAAAHHDVPLGISGVLSVHHYPSRYENWDFVDDVPYNPCNETVTTPRATALASYPITIRPENFTLPTWIDGRDWNFFAAQVPLDVFACDAWLLKEPTGYLWYLASHTNGYERVPTILRRRHTMSVCLALQAYNHALVAYKTAMCPFGFNANRKVPMELHKNAWATAVANAPGSVVAPSPVVYFGDASVPPTATLPQPGSPLSDDIHFVFSTTCEPYQDWQSQVLAHSFAAVKQRGRLTRILSGCSDADIAAALARARVTPFMELHVTKDFSDRPRPDMKLKDDYAPYNKPFGLRDWLATANPRVTASVVVIIDPDFMFLKPFVVNADARITRASGVDSENYDADAEVIEGLRQYKRFRVYEGTRSVANVSDRVTNGTAVAQRWSSYLGAAGFDDKDSTNFQICPECKKTTKEDGREYFAVGPPYALTRHDLSRMVDDYCNMTVAKRELHRDSWMAEMMGYVVAASRHDIKHTIFDNLALAGKDDEYWGFVDRLAGNPCDASDTPMVTAEVAPMLHGCHTYTGKDDSGREWMYYKQYMPNDLFACDAWLLAVPPPSVWTVAKASGDPKKLQHAYGLCTSVKVVNQALLAYKRSVCVDGFNANKQLRLVSPRAAMELQVGRVHDKWVQAAAEIAPTATTEA